MKCIRPLVLIAGIAFTENRFPGRRPPGVFPFWPQVRPVTWSERMPTWSENRNSPPSLFAFARIFGQVSSCQRRTTCGSCPTARLSGRWKDSPHRFRYLPTPGSVSRTRYSFAISRPPAATSTTTGKPHVTEPVIEDGLPHCGPLGRPEHLVHPDRLAARTHDQRLTPTRLPLRPPDVDRPQRPPEHRRYVLTVPPSHQRGHRPQPHGLLRRRRQMPRVPHQLAHTPPATQNPNRFGAIRQSGTEHFYTRLGWQL